MSCSSTCTFTVLFREWDCKTMRHYNTRSKDVQKERAPDYHFHNTDHYREPRSPNSFSIVMSVARWAKNLWERRGTLCSSRTTSQATASSTASARNLMYWRRSRTLPSSPSINPESHPYSMQRLRWGVPRQSFHKLSSWLWHPTWTNKLT